MQQQGTQAHQGFFFLRYVLTKIVIAKIHFCSMFSRQQKKKFPSAGGTRSFSEKSEGTFDRFFMTHEILQQIQNDMRNLLHSAKIGGITFLLTFHL